MDRNCPECGDKLIGRADKKYCSDACKNAHNNSNNRDSKNIVRRVNNRLRKNYRILEELNPQEKRKQPRPNSMLSVLILIILLAFILPK